MKPSVYIPAILLIYLCVMAYIGRFELIAGHYIYYFGLISISLVCIAALHLFLKRRERNRKK